MRDSKTPEMITALTGSLKDIKAILPFEAKEEPAKLPPGLYLFEFDPKTGLINNLKPVTPFKE